MSYMQKQKGVVKECSVTAKSFCRANIRRLACDQHTPDFDMHGCRLEPGRCRFQAVASRDVAGIQDMDELVCVRFSAIKT